MFNINTVTKRLQRIAIGVLCVVLGTLMLAPRVSASDWDKKTIVTFDEAVQIPGQALPAGTYVFKLMDSASNRHIVQIFDQAERKIVATLIAIPNDRMETPDRTMIHFEERLSSQPPAVKTWFYPGDSTGQEFVYPKDQELQVARNSPWAVKETVEVADDTALAGRAAVIDTTPTPGPADNAKTVPDTSTPDQSATGPQLPSPSAEETPDAGLPQDQDQAPATKPDTPSDKSDEPSGQLPKTASEIPLFAAIGLGALGSAGLVRFRRRRSALGL
jgi:LPXTG-motif cell wall-anchored protein